MKSRLAKLSPMQIGCGAALFTASIGVGLIALIVLFPTVIDQPGRAVGIIQSLAAYGGIAVGVIAYLWAKNRRK